MSAATSSGTAGRRPFELHLCNEVVRASSFAAQCDLAAALGYDGLEVAPFTLSGEPHRLSDRELARLRRRAEDAGIRIVGLHWLLTAPEGLSITSGDPQVRSRTLSVMRGLVDVCATLGGRVLVHGSPGQRSLAGDDPEGAAARGREAFAAVAPHAEAAGVTYLIEPLSRQETSFVTTVAEAAGIVGAVGSPALRTMIDVRAARLAEDEDVPALLDRWLPEGVIAHVHLNDTNRRAPGQGSDAFAPILDALVRNDYRGAASVEPFVYEPDGPTTAARAIGYLDGVLEGLASRGGRRKEGMRWRS